MVEVLVCLEFHNKIFPRTKSNIFWHSNIGCVIKTREMFSFLCLVNNSVTIGLILLLLSISAVISSAAINILCFLFGLYSSTFLCPYHLSIQ